MRRTADYIHCYVVLLIDFCLLLATKHVLLVFYPLNTSMFRLAHWTFTMDFSLPNIICCYVCVCELHPHSHS